jgi:hypothetical protein
LKAELEVILRACHIILESCECQLGLDHPELGQVAGCVRVFRAESRAEGVHVTEGAAIVFHAELSGDGQEGGLPEEILLVVNFLLMELLWLRLLCWCLLNLLLVCLHFLCRLLIFLLLLLVLLRFLWLRGNGWNLRYGSIRLRQNSSDLEHLSSAFTIGRSNDGRVNVEEAALLKELMSGVCEVVPDAGHGANEVCAGTQVSDLSQVLVRVSLLRQGVHTWVAFTHDLHEMSAVWSRHLQFERLTFLGTFDQGTLDLETGADISFLYLIIAFDIFSHYDLIDHSMIINLLEDP